MKKNTIILGIISGIVFMLYNIIVFTFVGEKSPIFWSAYIFTSLAFMAQVIAFSILYKKDATIKDVFLGIPLTIISFLYLLIQVVVGLIFFIAPDISLSVTNVVQIVILTAYMIFAVSALMAKDVVKNISDKSKQKVHFVKLLEDDVISLQSRIKEPELQTKLNLLGELIRFSDPMSHPTLSLLEQNISRKVVFLTEKVQSGATNEIHLIIDEIASLMEERNRKCKLLK